MKVSELLNEHNWIKGERALNHGGMVAIPEDVDACQFCLIGAIDKCYKDSQKRVDICDMVRDYLGIVSIVRWNDNPERTFTDIHQVITALDI